jgi:hypothetical protein
VYHHIWLSQNFSKGGRKVLDSPLHSGPLKVLVTHWVPRKDSEMETSMQVTGKVREEAKLAGR